MSISSQEFLDELSRSVPESGELVSDHLDFNGELLLHLLISDLRRMAIEMFDRGSSDSLERLLGVVDRALTEGDDYLRDAVAVCFVEDTGWWDPEMSGFINRWPAGLTAEVERQRQWRPDAGAP